MAMVRTIRPSEVVCDTLRGASIEHQPDGGVVLRIVQQLDRALYVEVNRVLEQLGGHWDKRRRGHVFSAGNNPIITLDTLVSDGEVDIERLDFFATPRAIAERMVRAANLVPGCSILEPSAGEGAIADTIVDLTAIPRSKIDCIEIDPRRAEVLRSKGYSVIGSDFLDGNWAYDRILMNPPFSGQRDINHVIHAYRCLCPGGRLVALMAEGAFFREDRKSHTFRALLSAAGESKRLPDGVFKESGTLVVARMVTMDKMVVS